MGGIRIRIPNGLYMICRLLSTLPTVLGSFSARKSGKNRRKTGKNRKNATGGRGRKKKVGDEMAKSRDDFGLCGQEKALTKRGLYGTMKPSMEVTEMTHRENFLRAVRRESPESVPFWLELCPSLKEELKKRYGTEDVQEAFDTPIRYLGMWPTRRSTDFRKYFDHFPEGAYTDDWGVGYAPGSVAILPRSSPR